MINMAEHTAEASKGYMWKDRATLVKSPDFRHEVKTKKIRCDKCSTIIKKGTS